MTRKPVKDRRAALLTLAAQHCRRNAPNLGSVALRDRLANLDGWKQAGGHIEKTFRFADYYRTIAFVNAVASLAHREDHHPDLAVYYDHCVVTWSTHSAGGVTRNDCICAAKTESFYA